MAKILCGFGEMFYADYSCSLRARELLLQFQFDPSADNASALLDNKELREYCDNLAEKCPSKCSCFGVSLKERIETFRRAEKKPGGLCAVALYEKAALVAFKRW